MPADVNRSYQAKPFDEKAPHYAKQNLYAASLTRAAYQHQPQFQAFIAREGLPFRPYESFGKAEQRERRDLVLVLTQKVWSPQRLKDPPYIVTAVLRACRNISSGADLRYDIK